MKKKYLVILDCGDEEVYFFDSIVEILTYFDVDNLQQLKNNTYVTYIIEIKDIIHQYVFDYEVY